ncbi:hypothetical protein [Rhodococcus sp. 27YEA15]|uniref:hypothetical protein n=1 Tax=Rhodococcus sp. 27YEA15 TaxID=3156259 RepID=UPI003C7B933E
MISRKPVDITTGVPVKLGAIVTNGWVTRLFAAVPRVLVDAAGADNLGALLAGSRVAGRTAFDQLDQARWESSSEGAMASERAAVHLRQVSAIADSAPQLSVVDGGVLRRTLAVVPSGETDTLRIAAAYRVSSSSVLLAYFAEASNRWLGQQVFAARLGSANRYTESERVSVTRLKTFGFVAFTFGGDNYLRRVFLASLRAYEHARIDPAAARRLLPPEFIQFEDRRQTLSIYHYVAPPTGFDQRDQPVLKFFADKGDLPGALNLSVETNALCDADAAALLTCVSTLVTTWK